MADMPNRKPQKTRLSYPARNALLLAVLCFVGVFAFLLFRLTAPAGATVAVYRDGEKIAAFSLATDGEYVINGGTHRLIVENGTARVTDADCENRLCERRGAISLSGQSIVCLPNHLEIRVEGENAVDLVSE